MKKYDVAVIGSSPQSQRVASDLVKTGRKVALISLPDSPETLQFRILQTIDKHSGHKVIPVLESPLLTNMDLYSGTCEFVNERTLQLPGEQIDSIEFILASGAVLNASPLQGLSQVPFFTPLTLLECDPLPSSAIIIGAGPIGMALAALLASKNIDVQLVFRHPTIMPKEDAGLSTHVKTMLEQWGVRVWPNANPILVRNESGGKISLVFEQNGKRSETTTQALVLATGLIPNSDALNLKRGRVYANPKKEIVTNEDSRCSRTGVWALGPVTGLDNSFAFESYQADQIIHNIKAPFFDKKKQEPDEPSLFVLPGNLPVARVGLTEAEATQKFKKVFSKEIGAYLKLIAKKNGEILGVHATGPHAIAIGLFFEWAIRAQISINDLDESRYFPPIEPASLIHKAVRGWMDTYPWS